MRRGNLLLSAALAIVAFALSYGLALDADRMGLPFEFPEYADIAREVARGNGLATHVLYPSVLAWGDEAGVSMSPSGTYPVMNRHPGFAVALAPFVGIGGASDLAVHAGLSAFFALWVAVSFFFLAPLVGRRDALLGALMLLANPAFLRFFVPGGYADVLFAAAVLPFLAAGAGMLAAGDLRPWKWALLGLAGSAAWTIRYNFTLLPLVLAAAVLVARRDRAAVLAVASLLCAFAVGTLPARAWHAWTFASTESPPTFWNLLDGFPGYASPWKQYRVHGLSDLVDTGLWVPWLFEKIPYFLFLTVRSLPGAFLMIALFPFLVANLVLPGDGGPRRRLLLVAASGASLMALAFSGLRYEEWPAPGGRTIGLRYLIWFAPFLAAYGFHGLARLTDGRSTRFRALVLAVVLSVQALWFAAHLGPLGDVYRTRGRFEELPAAVALASLDREGRTDRALPIATNVPAHVGWYLDRPALLLPASPEEMALLAARHPVAGYLFTNLDIGEPLSYGAWTRTLSEPEALRGFLDANGLAIALRDEQAILLVPR